MGASSPHFSQLPAQGLIHISVEWVFPDHISSGTLQKPHAFPEHNQSREDQCGQGSCRLVLREGSMEKVAFQLDLEQWYINFLLLLYSLSLPPPSSNHQSNLNNLDQTVSRNGH